LVVRDQALLSSLEGVLTAQIALLGRNGAVASANEAWRAGATEAGSLITGALPGENLFTILRPHLERSATAQTILGHCRAALEGESDGFAVAYEGIALAGPRRFLLRGFRVPGGQPPQLMLVQDDVPAGPALDTDGVAERRETGGLHSALVSWVSHELKSPLTAIVAFSEILGHNRERTLTGKQLDYVRIIQRNAHRLHVLVNDLHDLSRLEAGNFTLKRSTFDAGELLDEAAQNMQPVLSGRHQRLTVSRRSLEQH
jgi:signal transduction histidine kinase